MLTQNDKSGNHSTFVLPGNRAQKDISEALLKQAHVHRTQLIRTFIFIITTTFVVFMHQIFLASNQVGDWHSTVHYAMLVITAIMLFGTWFTWKSYRELHRNQKITLDAYARSEQLSETTGDSLRETETVLESLFGVITDRILILDSDNRIVKANKVAIKWVGYDPSDHEFTEIFPVCNSQGERRSELSLIEYTRTTQRHHHGRMLRGGANCSMLLSVDTYPVKSAENDSDLIISIARDVTEQTGYELASRHREKMAALGLITAGFAHDLGNPLSSLSSELELLREEEGTEKIHKSLATVNEHVARIKRKLYDIVQFTRRPDENEHYVNTRDAINHVLKLTRYDPRAQRIQFDINLDDTVPPVRMNEDNFVLVLCNLIVNAFDAMPEGGTLTINTAIASTGETIVTVSDTGVGMDATTLQQATLPLFTTKNIRNAYGTGLGLTMSKQLITSSGGELSLASEPGGGTRIMLRFPLVTTQHYASKAAFS